MKVQMQSRSYTSFRGLNFLASVSKTVERHGTWPMFLLAPHISCPYMYIPITHAYISRGQKMLRRVKTFSSLIVAMHRAALIH